MLHFLYFLSEWPYACNCTYGSVELNSMRLILTPLYLSHTLQSVDSAQFSNFKEALNLTDLT